MTAMRRVDFFWTWNLRGNTPKAIPQRRIASCSRHIQTLNGRANVGSDKAGGERGCLRRIYNACVLCVPTRACRAGSSLRGDRRFCFSSFGTVPSRRLPICACALCLPSRSATACAAAILRAASVLRSTLLLASRVVPAGDIPPASRVPSARGAARRTDTVAEVCRYAGKRDAV